MKELFVTSKEDSVLLKVEEWSSTRKMYEVCGFVGKKDGKYTVILCENESKTPRSTFFIDPVEYLMFIENYEPVMSFHSHITGDEEASEKDIIMSENSCLPFLIYSLNTGKNNIYIPRNNNADEVTLNKFKKLI